VSRHVDTTPDFFADVPRETVAPHLKAARVACEEMLRARHWAQKRGYLKQTVAHLKALTRGEGKR
jgi:hypothetical protein